MYMCVYAQASKWKPTTKIINTCTYTKIHVRIHTGVKTKGEYEKAQHTYIPTHIHVRIHTGIKTKGGI